MTKRNTRRGYTQKTSHTEKNELFTSPLEGEDARRANEGEMEGKGTGFAHSPGLTPHPGANAHGPLPQGAGGTTRGFTIRPSSSRPCGRQTVRDIGAARGFTLIELLVVVLIIGILAAIAVPQYQKTVRKAKLAEVGVMFSNLSRAIDAWLLENGGYPEGKSAKFFGTDKTASLPLDIKCDSETDGQCNTSKGAWHALCYSLGDNLCVIKNYFHVDSAGNPKKNTWLTSSWINQNDRIAWRQDNYGPWKLNAVVTSDDQLRKQVCQWWIENYGVNLMVGTAASDHCQ